MSDAVILLVEDDDDDVTITMRTLKKNGIANDVVVVRSGIEALDYLFATGAYLARDASILPIIVLLDLKLPMLGGLEVLARIRADERTRELPVLLFRPNLEDEASLASDTRSSRENSSIPKPLAFSEFATATRKLGLSWRLIDKRSDDRARARTVSGDAARSVVSIEVT